MQQTFRRRESSEVFSQKRVHLRYSTTVPAKRHEVNSRQLFQKIGQKVAGSTHAAERIGSLWNALLRALQKPGVSFEGRNSRMQNLFKNTYT